MKVVCYRHARIEVVFVDIVLCGVDRWRTAHAQKEWDMLTMIGCTERNETP